MCDKAITGSCNLVIENSSISVKMSQMSTHQRGSKLAKLQKMASINAQMRLLVPKKLSEDDQLVEYDTILLDRFLNVLQDLHGADIKETDVSILGI